MFPSSSVTTTPYSSGFGTEWSTIVACEPRSVWARITEVRSMSVSASPLITRRCRRAGARRCARCLRCRADGPRRRTRSPCRVSETIAEVIADLGAEVGERHHHLGDACSLSRRRMCSSTGRPPRERAAWGDGWSVTQSRPFTSRHDHCLHTATSSAPVCRCRSYGALPRITREGCSVDGKDDALVQAHEAKPLEQPVDDTGHAKSAASRRAATRRRSPSAGCSTRPRSALAISAGSSVSTTIALP